MIDYWTQFSGTGSPNNFNTPLWLPYVPGVGDVNELVPSVPFMSTKFQSFHHTEFWLKVSGLGGLGLAGTHGVHPKFLTLEAFDNAARKLRAHAN
jgi:hypothetical protein